MALEFDGTPPVFPDCDGLVSSWTVGQRLEVIIMSYGDEHRKLAESLSPASIDVVELNLEDAFIEYTRGPRRSLPLLAGDDNHVESTSVQGAA